MIIISVAFNTETIDLSGIQGLNNLETFRLYIDVGNLTGIKGIEFLL